MSPERFLMKLDRFIGFAWQLASLSTCKRRQNGAIIFPVDCGVVSAIGYNGPARGLSNDRCTGVKGDCECAHAEVNAIAKCHSIDTRNILFSTSSPCVQCANAIINSGMVRAMIYDRAHSDPRGIGMLTEAGIYAIRYCDLTKQYMRLLSLS